MGTSDDEVEAESHLAAVGVVPRNGWIADYPVTPDIVGELYKSVRDAAAAGRLPMGTEEALKRLTGVIDELHLSIRPADAGKTAQATPSGVAAPPAPEDVHDYYASEGPPIVTYYAPPRDYYYLYSWVPYPFWWTGIWFPGFFVLNDFHRTMYLNNRVVFYSNHYNDIRRHRVFRIDPYERYRGRTYTGIGVARYRGSISTGIPRSERNIFNGYRTRGLPDGRRDSAPRRGGGYAAPPAGEGRGEGSGQRGGSRR